MVELQTALENEHDLDERERLRSSVAGDSRAAWQFARESGAFQPDSEGRCRCRIDPEQSRRACGASTY